MRLFFLLLFLTGCQGALRTPLCHPGEFEFPDGVAGRYRFTVPASSVAYGGAWTELQDMEFTLTEGPGQFELTATKLPQDATPGLALPLAVCKIGNSYYSQSEQEDGTFSIARVDVSPTGITTTSLVFAADELKRAGFKIHFAPKFEDVDGKNEWHFDGMQSQRLIVDNTGIDDQRREQLVALAHPTVYGFVFSRVDAATEGRKSPQKPVAVRLTLPKKM